jgi:type IV pilus assembly PilO-like protein
MTAKLAQNKVTIAAAAAVALFAILAYLVVVGPKRSRATELEDSIETTRVELTQARIDQARAKAAPTAPIGDLKKLTKAMPNQADMPGVIFELARVAHETGISFDSITPSEPVAASGYQKVPVSLVFQGNFFELSDFLYRLRNLVQVRDDRLRVEGRLFAVEGIDFAQGTKQFPEVQATLNASAFVYGGAPATTPPGTPPADTSGTSAAGAP